MNDNMQLSAFQLQLINDLLNLALLEDVHEGDHTSLACVPKHIIQKAKLLVKSDGVISGIEIAKMVMHKVDSKLKIDQLMQDGDAIKFGDIAFYISGNPVSILTAERLLLNIMQRMSGIATFTNSLVKKIQHTEAKILDTRKTAPGMRVLEKMAVLHGGAFNHRMGLYDMIMIKDNHIDFAGGIENAIDKVHAYLNTNELELKIEIEARSMNDVNTILKKGGVDRIMLDNFSPEQIIEALPIINKQYETEASGGINEHNLVKYAETGVDFISIGALTHQVKSLDLSLKAC
jgi:nicotinate-nucleotide pyrophosphorylase (carboxylating)